MRPNILSDVNTTKEMHLNKIIEIICFKNQNSVQQQFHPQHYSRMKYPLE